MQTSDEETRFDIVVVGAGVTGVIAAQRYLQAHPNCRLAILEQDYCVGGVWSERRSYDNLWTQWSYGLGEFSDMPMERPPEEDYKHDLFKAKYQTEYLEKYVDHMHHAGQSLRERIHFNIKVELIEKIGDQWRLSCANVITKMGKVFSAAKLMLANGENSLPNIPNLPGKDVFDGVILHSFDFGKSNIIQDNSIEHIAVLGAGKSSADMIYEAVKAGKSVSWIIRKTGPGAGFFAPIDMSTPYKNPGEAAQTRVMSSLQPCLLNKDSLWTWFLHRTSIGIWLVTWLFSLLDAEIRKRANFKSRGSKKSFEKLDFDTGIFWQNNTGGAVHHADFWPLIAEKVQVYRDDVKMLSNKELHLGDGTHFLCDAVLCGTGWKVGIEFFDTDLRVKLDLPHREEDEPYETTARWEKLTLEADEKIRKQFPLLANPPKHTLKRTYRTPFRLYKCLAPLKDDSILFMNYITASSKLFAAEAQAIWAVAFFDKNIVLPSIEEREKEIAAWIAWNRRRYLSNGQLGMFVVFDTVPYVDGLLNDIGVTAHRKGWIRDIFEPFMPADLGKASGEYLNRHRE